MDVRFLRLSFLVSNFTETLALSGKILPPNPLPFSCQYYFVFIYLNESDLCFTEKDADIQPEVGEGGGIVEGTYTVKLNEGRTIFGRFLWFQNLALA